MTTSKRQTRKKKEKLAKKRIKATKIFIKQQQAELQEIKERRRGILFRRFPYPLTVDDNENQDQFTSYASYKYWCFKSFKYWGKLDNKIRILLKRRVAINKFKKEEEILFRKFPYPLSLSEYQQHQFDSYAHFMEHVFINEKECDWSLY